MVGTKFFESSFEAFGDDAPFFGEVAWRGYEARQKDAKITQIVQDFLEDVLDEFIPKPVYSKPSKLWISEEDLDIKMMELVAQDKVNERVCSAQDKPSEAEQDAWYNEELDRLAHEYVFGDYDVHMEAPKGYTSSV